MPNDKNDKIVAECWTCDPPTRRLAGRCRAYLRRVRPQGYTMVCEAPASIETWALHADGRMIYHGARCAGHPDTARYSSPDTGWRIEYVPLGMERHRAADHDVRPVVQTPDNAR